MKKKTILGTLGAFTLASILSVGLFASLGSSKSAASVAATSEAVKPAPEYSTFVNLRDGWIENTDGSAETNLNSAIRARNDRFWNGAASGWDSQERTFNSTDEFVDTIHRANGGEGWRGAYRTPELVLHDNNHRYISFMFGGGGDDIFVNVFQVSGAAGSGDRITGIRTRLNETGYYDHDGNVNPDKLNAPISCNMTFYYYELPNEIQPGDHFLLYVRDGRTGGYGGFTFGDVHINQTLEDVAKCFSAHKQQMMLNRYTSDWNANAIDYVLDYYENKADQGFPALRAAEAALVDADDDFEVNQHLSNWAYDRQFSTADVNTLSIYSDNDAKDWQERMPANKTGNLYLNADTSGIGEGERYRLVSNEFTLSGTGFISAKLGGGTAVLTLIDSNGDELISSRIADSEGENKLNPGFKDAAVDNVMASGSRLNTMSRVYLDASEHVGKKVRVRLSDDRTGGGWGLAYFDEVVTKYDSVPTLKVDKIQQQWNDSPLYHGVVTDKYVGPNNTDFGKAYAFVQSYYEVMRSAGNGQSWCSVVSTNEVKQLLEDYDDLESSVKALVDAAQDYDFGMGKTSSNWYLSEAVLGTVGASIAYAQTINEPQAGLKAFNLSGEAGVGGTIVIVTLIIAFVITSFYFVLKLRRKSHN